MSHTDPAPAHPESFTHSDGQVCYYLPYARDGVSGLLHGYFYGAPPDMHRCHREHGLEGADDEQPD
jgi:hypothetical protein